METRFKQNSLGNNLLPESIEHVNDRLFLTVTEQCAALCLLNNLSGVGSVCKNSVDAIDETAVVDESRLVRNFVLLNQIINL